MKETDLEKCDRLINENQALLEKLNNTGTLTRSENDKLHRNDKAIKYILSKDTN